MISRSKNPLIKWFITRSSLFTSALHRPPEKWLKYHDMFQNSISEWERPIDIKNWSQPVFYMFINTKQLQTTKNDMSLNPMYNFPKDMVDMNHPSNEYDLLTIFFFFCNHAYIILWPSLLYLSSFTSFFSFPLHRHLDINRKKDEQYRRMIN